MDVHLSELVNFPMNLNMVHVEHSILDMKQSCFALEKAIRKNALGCQSTLIFFFKSNDLVTMVHNIQIIQIRFTLITIRLLEILIIKYLLLEVQTQLEKNTEVELYDTNNSNWRSQTKFPYCSLQ